MLTEKLCGIREGVFVHKKTTLKILQMFLKFHTVYFDHILCFPTSYFLSQKERGGEGEGEGKRGREGERVSPVLCWPTTCGREVWSVVEVTSHSIRESGHFLKIICRVLVFFFFL